MMYVSGLLEKAAAQGCSPVALELAQHHLYQGQCNCTYWHGAFGGIYLPHLRNAVYYHLLKAESTLEQVMGRPQQWVEATNEDYDFDGRQEIRLANDKIAAWISPTIGGQIYELDVRSIAHNLGATIQRRPELYHEKVRQGENDNADDAASIHDRVVFKHADLDKQLFYDSRMPNSLVDHFWDEEVDVQAVEKCEAMERGDFADGEYAATVRSNPDRVQVLLTKEGNAWGVPLTIKKGVTLNEGSHFLEITYMIEGLPTDRTFHFGVDFNFAGMPDGQDDRYFSNRDGEKLGQLGETLDLKEVQGISLTDEWLGISVELESDRPGGLFAYPIRTVSQSESGFELVHQSVCVQPHWMVQADENGRWVCRMKLALKTTKGDDTIPADSRTDRSQLV